MFTSPGPHLILMLTSPGPHVILMLTSRGPHVTLAWQAAALVKESVHALTRSWDQVAAASVAAAQTDVRRSWLVSDAARSCYAGAPTHD